MKKIQAYALELILRVLAFILPTASVERAVKGLAKAGALLEAAEAAQNQKAGKLVDELDNLDRIVRAKSAAADAALEEAARARRVRHNIAALTA